MDISTGWSLSTMTWILLTDSAAYSDGDAGVDSAVHFDHGNCGWDPIITIVSPLV